MASSMSIKSKETVQTYDESLAHEGPVWLPKTKELLFVSNRLMRPREEGAHVKISVYNPSTNKTRDLGLDKKIHMANGAIRCKDGRVVICMQGDKVNRAGLAFYNTTNGVVDSIFTGDGRHDQFNSPNDVEEADDGAIWFTDPSYGYLQGFRPEPTFGDWVWRVDFKTEPACQTKMIDGFSKPNGIHFSLCETYVYVTDTGHATGKRDPTGKQDLFDASQPRAIYRFTVNKSTSGALPLVGGRKLFAIASSGIPDGIKVDSQGRVWAGTGAGLEVFNTDGLLIQTIHLDGGCSNFQFAEEGTVYAMGQKKLYKVTYCFK